MFRRCATSVLVLSFLILILLGAACKPQKSSAPSGTLNISGAWALYPLVAKWAEVFKEQNPQIIINISAGGAGKGMTDVLSGAVDIAMVSRDVDEAETAKGAYPIFVARDGVFPTISSKNPAKDEILTKGITRQTLIDLYIQDKKLTWNDVGGGSDAPVRVYTRSDACGAAVAWASTLGKYKQDQLKGTGVYGDPGLLEAVRRDPLALGYNNLSYLFEGDKVIDGVLIVPIDIDNNSKADPSEIIDTREKACNAIASGTYPGARREYLVTKGKPGSQAADFIEFALSDAGTKALEEVGGYVPLSKAERDAATAKIR